MPNVHSIKLYTINIGGMDASGSVTSSAIDLRTYDIQHRFSVQSVVGASGAPVYKIEYQTSNDGTNFVTGATEIATAQVKGATAPITFAPPLARYIKFIVTETGTSVAIDSCILTFAVQ